MQLFSMMANQLSGQAALTVLRGAIHSHGDGGHPQVADILKDINIPAPSPAAVRSFDRKRELSGGRWGVYVGRDGFEKRNGIQPHQLRSDEWRANTPSPITAPTTAADASSEWQQLLASCTWHSWYDSQVAVAAHQALGWGRSQPHTTAADHHG